MWYNVLIAFVVSYLLGSINTSIIVSKLFGESDIRKKGSGNAGATNTLRVVGKKAAILVVIGDGLKGVIAVLASGYIAQYVLKQDYDIARYVASVAVVVGHVFPVFFGFKGGKGIMTAIAVIFVLDWIIACILLGVFVALVICFNYISLGSCVGCACYPVLVAYFHRGETEFLISSIIIALIAIIKHRTNIVRLVNGTESKLIKKKSKEV